MSRIVYIGLASDQTAGGTKVIFRHVEALRALGHDAVVVVARIEHAPTWFEHDVPIEVGAAALREDDQVVVPEDAVAITRLMLARGMRPTVFCQNQHYCTNGVAQLSAEELAQLRDFIAPSRTVAEWLRWRFPGTEVTILPGFADERLFRSAKKSPAVLHIPRKRRDEVPFIRDAFRFGHPDHAGTRWIAVEKATEAALAQAMARSSLFLSLSRFEGLGLTPLEAMASGCLVAGFTGGGGREYATPENGFWAQEDDLMGAAEALGAAAELSAEGGPGLQTMLEAGFETARRWSHAAFVQTLEAYWGPRIRSRP